MNTEKEKMRKKRWFSRSGLKELIKKLVRVDDSPQKIARGVAIGVFWGILPTFGLAILFSLPTAVLLRANKLSAILGTFVANPFTAPFIYAFEYKIGELILRNTPLPFSWSLFRLEHLLNIGRSLLVGSFLLATGMTLLTYFLTFGIALGYRKKRSLKATSSKMTRDL